MDATEQEKPKRETPTEYYARVSRETRESGKRLVTVPRGNAEFPNGVDVFSVPKDADVQDEDAIARYWIGWFPEAPK
jgi:hypothetical protein